MSWLLLFDTNAVFKVYDQDINPCSHRVGWEIFHRKQRIHAHSAVRPLTGNSGTLNAERRNRERVKETKLLVLCSFNIYCAFVLNDMLELCNNLYKAACSTVSSLNHAIILCRALHTLYCTMRQALKKWKAKKERTTVRVNSTKKGFWSQTQSSQARKSESLFSAGAGFPHHQLYSF